MGLTENGSPVVIQHGALSKFDSYVVYAGTLDSPHSLISQTPNL